MSYASKRAVMRDSTNVIGGLLQLLWLAVVIEFYAAKYLVIACIWLAKMAYRLAKRAIDGMIRDRRDARGGKSSSASPTDDRAEFTVGLALIRATYVDASNEHWRPFLDVLASQPDQWIAGTAAFSAVGLGPSRAAQMIEREEKRSNWRMPYERRGPDATGEMWFKMSSRAASAVARCAENYGNLAGGG